MSEVFVSYELVSLKPLWPEATKLEPDIICHPLNFNICITSRAQYHLPFLIVDLRNHGGELGQLWTRYSICMIIKATLHCFGSRAILPREKSCQRVRNHTSTP